MTFLASREAWSSPFEVGGCCPRPPPSPANRRSAALSSGSLYRKSDDPNDIVLTFEWDSRENAEAFLNSDNLREIMGEAGVVGQPEFIFADKLEDFQS
jgi:hypothetical protein